MFGFVAEWVGLPVDEVNYFICFLLSFPLAFVLRKHLSYKTTSVAIRNAYCGLFGIALCIVCFQWQTVLLLLYAVGAYGLLGLNRGTMQMYTLLYCYLIVCSFHIYRMVFDYGHYTLDLSFPLMVMMQRITYVGFSYHDGNRKTEDLNDDQKSNRIINKPTIMEYFSYVFSFYSVLTGPTSTYVEHNDMITGKNFEVHLTDKRHMVPFNLTVVVQKAAVGAVCLMISMIGGSFDLDEVVLDPSLAFPHRLIYVTVFSFTLRCKYYFVWMTIESVSNLTGLGFNGFDKFGIAKWDLVSNINILEFEFGPYYKRIILFNRLTALWLKRIGYERFKKHRYIITYIMSCIWHGFYPGYYLFYIVVLTGFEAAKKINRKICPYLESSSALQVLYNVASYMGCTIIIDFCNLAFFFLVHDKIYIAWKYYYCIPFLASLAVVLLLPSKKQTKTD